jgi:hypothetical protein
MEGGGVCSLYYKNNTFGVIGSPKKIGGNFRENIHKKLFTISERKKCIFLSKNGYNIVRKQKELYTGMTL